MSSVVFLQSKFPQNDIAFNDLIMRWCLYQKIYITKTNGKKIYFLSTNKFPASKQLILSKYTSIDFLFQEQRFFNKILNTRKLINQSSEKFTLVCGDNQLSLLIALILKYTISRNVKIQTQFHGDTYSYSSNKGFYGFLRVIFSRIAINSSDSIRVVSRFQVHEIAALTNKSHINYVIAPIPIDMFKIPNSSSTRNIDVLIVGRLHRERGISEMIHIIDVLISRDPKISIYILGDGPLRKFMEGNLLNLNSNSNVHFMGHIGNTELSDYYSNAKTLLSSAPKEGYGLTLREAALSGTFVVARESLGSVAAKQDFPQMIEIYSTTDEAVALIEKQMLKQSINASDSLKFEQKIKDFEHMEKLVISWILD